MPITRAKTTVFFQSKGGDNVPDVGWTETWYSADTDYSDALDRAKKYVKVRKELLGFGATIIAVRVSDDAIKRDTLIAQFLNKDGQSSVFVSEVAGDQFDPLQVDLLVRIESGPLYRRSAFVAGLPDKFTDQMRNSGVEGAFSFGPQFTQWAKFLVANYQFRVKNRANPSEKILVPITNLVPRMVRNRKRGRPFNLFRGKAL